MVLDVASSQVPTGMTEMFGPLVKIIAPILSTVSWVLGGAFGIYLILVIVKIYYDHKRIKILKEIRNDVKFLREQVSFDNASKLINIDKKESKKNNSKNKTKLKKKNSNKKK